VTEPSRAKPGPIQLLIVEDDDGIASPLESGLEREGFSVTRVATGGEALAATPPDVLLLDLRLPDMDGFDVCRAFRARGSVAILILSARTDETDRVLGLELGADDYIPKPYGLREVIARIRAVLRRSASGHSDGAEIQQLGTLTIDRRRRRVHVGPEEIVLTAKEFDLLAALAEDPGAVVERQELLERVWDSNWYGPTKTLDVHVSTLRRKLGDPQLIETVRGVGFRIAVGT
jgi:two-component system response regulator RegX3